MPLGFAPPPHPSPNTETNTQIPKADLVLVSKRVS
jgi:hypothetical protein